ncbi:MAG: hypothetical protein HY070_02530 [Chloroflexi bacterium]|nr:hypothetical protein [Chloroflexota bacterium]MBI3741437.1 hypothetical protein [Chloroflexota bacterium]
MTPSNNVVRDPFHLFAINEMDLDFSLFRVARGDKMNPPRLDHRPRRLLKAARPDARKNKKQGEEK